MDRERDVNDLFKRLSAGDRVALAQAITLVESNAAGDRAASEALIDHALLDPPSAVRVGITGIPGVGKSTLIDALGMAWIAAGSGPAVLAIDPSSARSGGSVLGDKTRMTRLSTNAKAFVRPSAASGALGGVARRTKEAMLLCEAAGYDRVVIETVGIGQSEISVDQLVDVNVLLTVAGTGDELQGIKRGIMESADLIVVTKADGDNSGRSEQARLDLRSAISLLPPRANGSRPDVLLCSAIEDRGIDALLAAIEALAQAGLRSGHREERRRAQQLWWLKSTIEADLLEHFRHDPRVAARWIELSDAVAQGRSSPFRAAAELIDLFRTSSSPLP